ncbi:MAG: hypothetical protein PVH19_03405 [Planctomycetia bacterium]|jgi:flagellin-like hook-associated protein FlgL
MTYIAGIASGRVSNASTQNRLLNQVMSDQSALYRTELQLSTGRKYDLPSEDPLASMRITDLQRLLEQKGQIQQNIDLGGSYMALSDSTLMSVNDLLIQARALGTTSVGDTTSTEQKLANAVEVSEVISQMLDTSNTMTNGRYLFSGTTLSIPPYLATESGYVQYVGSDISLESYSDLSTLFQTNVPGCEVFGGISEAVEGTVDVNPNLLFDTRLSDLNGGKGVTLGSFAIYNEDQASVIDISGCSTIGDVAQLINANPPPGCYAEVEITPDALRIRLEGPPGTNLRVTEIASGTTAAELGILHETGLGTGWLDGEDLDPILRDTTSLDQTLGTYAQAIQHSPDATGTLIFTADDIGEAANDIEIIIENTAIVPGGETAVWNATARTLTIGIVDGVSDADDVIAAVATTAAPLTVTTDPISGPNAGSGPVFITPVVPPFMLTGGTGQAFDRTGLQITNDGEVYNISFNGAETYQDILNLLNASEAKVRATINDTATGINLQTTVSGCDFMVSENGGVTATQLGIRTFNAAVYLSELNYGFGVEIREDVPDFSITLSDATELEVDLAHQLTPAGVPLPDPAETIQDVLNIINDNPDNVFLDAAGNPVLDGLGNPLRKVIARVGVDGNGIELVDRSMGTGGLTVTKNLLSAAAWQLGLVPEDEGFVTTPSSAVVANGTSNPPGPDNAVLFNATSPGYYGDFTIQYEVQAVPGPISLDFDLPNRELTFYINDEASGIGTTSNDVVALLAADPDASMYFSGIALGTGLGYLYPIGLTPAEQAEWPGGVFTAYTTGSNATDYLGADVNPQEAGGVFDALIRLQNALIADDNLGIQHSIDVLEDAFMQFTFSQADLGAREQGLDVMNSRLQDETLELETLLSEEADADYAEVASNLLAQQAAYQASLKAMSTNFRMSLLDYI